MFDCDHQVAEDQPSLFSPTQNGQWFFFPSCNIYSQSHQEKNSVLANDTILYLVTILLQKVTERVL